EEGKEAILNMTAYSGKIIPKHWYWGDLVIDVSGMKISDKNIPILQDHETDRKVGFGTFKKENNQILSDKTAFVDTADANEFIRLSKKGFPYQASIQGRPIRIQKLSEDETAEVNGFTMKGPGTIWRESVLVECSVCTFGADSNTKSVAMSENQDMEVEIEQTLKEKEVQNMDLKQFQTEHPDLYAQVFSLGKTEGITEGKTSAETSFKADKTLLESWVKALHSENVKLTEHSSDVERRIVALEKTQALTVEQGIKSTADSAFSEIMVKHDIPERLRPKIRKQLNHQSFIADDKLDVCKFQEAIETELKDWVSDAEETSVMGFSITNNSNKTGSEDTMVTRMLNYVGVTTKQ
ncbi:MAG: hypothetical protein LLG05_09560, partial [Porphyromonadaceae bacterium]|nr:hypothetical protein [Porphyromonadaceae bacterium]